MRVRWSFCLDGGNCRTDAKHTDNCRYNYIARLNGGTSNETVHAIAYFDISIRKACAKLFGIVFITYTDKLWLKFPCLFLYKERFLPQESATTCISPCSLITSSVCVPIEPVEPSIDIFS